MNKLLIPALFILTFTLCIFGISCTPSEPRSANFSRTFKIGNFTTVDCGGYVMKPCGLTLLKCSDGNEYYCMTNVIIGK